MKTFRWILFFTALVLLLINFSVRSFASTTVDALVSGFLLAFIVVLLIDQVHRFLISRRFTDLPIPEEEKVTILREEKGVVYFSPEGRQRGMLLLTVDALRFLYRPLHSEGSGFRLPLDEIKAIHSFNRYLILPTGLRIIMNDDEVYEFLTEERGGWIRDIREQAKLQESVKT